MKQFCFLFSLIFNCFASGQMVHEWINTQYDPSEMAELTYLDYLVLNGSVESFYEVQSITGASKEITTIYVQVALQRNGFLKSVHKIYADSSQSISDFSYLPGSDAYVLHWVSIFNFGVRKDTLRDEIYTGNYVDWQIHADTFAFDANKNIIYFRKNRDEVFTSFDEFGRKIRDSIPSSPTIMGHEIRYKYKKNKIVKTESYFDQEIEIKSIYEIDDQGNWIKCTIKSNGRVKNAVIRRKINYFE